MKMSICNCILLILVSTLSSVRAEGETVTITTTAAPESNVNLVAVTTQIVPAPTQEANVDLVAATTQITPAPTQEANVDPIATTTAPPPETVKETTEIISEIGFTDYRMIIDLSLGSLLVRIVDWQTGMFNHIQSNLSPLSVEWSNLKSTIASRIATQEVSIKSTDIDHSKTLLQQQVNLLSEALSTSNKIENNLVLIEKEINQWIADVSSNVQGSRDCKENVINSLDSMVSSARSNIKETKSAIQKAFKNHYYSIDNDRLRVNGKLDSMNLEGKSALNELMTKVQVTNNSLSNLLDQEAHSLQETIDSTVSSLRHHLDSHNLMIADRDKIVNHLDERSQQLDENLFIGHSENLVVLENFVQNLIQDIQSAINSIDFELNAMKARFESLTTINKSRSNRLSIQTYKTLEPLESLLSSLTKKLRRTVDSVNL